MKSRGFTIVELVVVIILLGILAGTALPRFFSGTDQAATARLLTIAAAMQTANMEAKAQWLLEGRPNSIRFEDGTRVNLDRVVGFPVDDTNQNNDTIANMGIPECVRVFAAVLKTSETATNSTNAGVLRQNDFFVRRINGAGGSPDSCVYYVIDEDLIASRPNNAAIDPRYPALVYTPIDGRVVAVNTP